MTFNLIYVCEVKVRNAAECFKTKKTMMKIATKVIAPDVSRDRRERKDKNEEKRKDERDGVGTS